MASDPARLRADVAAGTVQLGAETVPARFGRAGAIPAGRKREGDGATPLGLWQLRTVLVRPDRGLSVVGTGLPWRWLRPDDGWSDDPACPAYNRPVRHPSRFSAEQLWRADGAYDVIVTLAHNDAPPVPGLGSAIFLHCAHEDGRPTAGCVALDRAVLARWLRSLKASAAIEIRP
jgi:L,D-peptidoglycan transpeptidase YkuD (ErfK/YbiS/YcfS/YnhG family)